MIQTTRFFTTCDLAMVCCPCNRGAAQRQAISHRGRPRWAVASWIQWQLRTGLALRRTIFTTRPEPKWKPGQIVSQLLRCESLGQSRPLIKYMEA